jgi:hypothetical protein
LGEGFPVSTTALIYGKITIGDGLARCKIVILEITPRKEVFFDDRPSWLKEARKLTPEKKR